MRPVSPMGAALTNTSGPGSLDMLFEEGKGNEIAVTLYNTFPLTFPLQMSLWSSSWQLFLNSAPFSEERVLLITHSQNSTERWTIILFHARNSRLFVFVWFMICGKSLTLKCVLGPGRHKVLWVWIKISWQWSWQQATIYQCNVGVHNQIIKTWRGNIENFDMELTWNGPGPSAWQNIFSYLFVAEFHCV